MGVLTIPRTITDVKVVEERVGARSPSTEKMPL